MNFIEGCKEDLRDVKKRREIIFYSIACIVLFSVMFSGEAIINSYGFTYWLAAILIPGYSFHIINLAVIRKDKKMAIIITSLAIISVIPSLFIYLFLNW